VFRLARGTIPKDFEEQRQVLPVSFELSEADKQDELKSLSVWARDLTEPTQAIAFMTGDTSRFRMALYLRVQDVVSARPQPDSPDVPLLDVVWHRLLRDVNGSVVFDDRPGAEGHAGITGLDRPPAVSREHYRRLRRRLAELCTVEVLTSGALPP
jgi:hypothetical protein